MKFKTVENGLIECTSESDYFAFTLEKNGDIHGLSPKGVYHCAAKDLIDLGNKVQELQGEKV